MIPPSVGTAVIPGCWQGHILLSLLAGPETAPPPCRQDLVLIPILATFACRQRANPRVLLAGAGRDPHPRDDRVLLLLLRALQPQAMQVRAANPLGRYSPV